MEQRYKYVFSCLSPYSIYQKVHPLRDAAFDADCLTPLRILKIIIVSLKLESGNTIKNCYMF